MTPARHKALIKQWLSQKHIAPDKTEQALAIATVTPPASAWFGFLDRLLLSNGVGLILIGLIFFFAFNWQEITRFHKFAMLELLIVGTLVAHYKFAAKANANYLILVASVLLGVLLAFYGQTYQTGADTWQLFAMWALLISPWVLLARFAALWMLWLILANLSLVLYYQVFHGLFGLVFSGTAMQWALWLFNTLALIIWEFAAKRYSWLSQSRSQVRLLAIVTHFNMVWLMIDFIFSHGFRDFYLPIIYLAWLAAFYGYYRYQQLDVFMLAGVSLSVIVISTAWFSDLLLQSKDGFALLVIGLWIMFSSGWAVRHLKAIAQEVPHE